MLPHFPKCLCRTPFGESGKQLHQPLIFRKTQTSSILFVPSGNFIGRTFALKKVFQSFKRGVKRGYHNLCYLGKHNPFKTSPNIFVPSCKFIGRTFAFKKFYGVFKRGVKRGYTDSWFSLYYLGKHNPPQPSSFQVASLSDEHSLLKSFSEF